MKTHTQDSEAKIIRRVALWLERRSRAALRRHRYGAAREVQQLAAELHRNGLPGYLRGVEMPANLVLFPGADAGENSLHVTGRPEIDEAPPVRA